MILFKENLCGYELVQDNVDSTLYTKTFTEQLLHVECKFTVYNIDENEYLTLYFYHSFMVDTTASGGITDDKIDTSFIDLTVGGSIQAPLLRPVIVYDQSTSELSVVIRNDGGFASEIACNWLLSVRVLKDS